MVPFWSIISSGTFGLIREVILAATIVSARRPTIEVDPSRIVRADQGVVAPCPVQGCIGMHAIGIHQSLRGITHILKLVLRNAPSAWLHGNRFGVDGMLSGGGVLQIASREIHLMAIGINGKQAGQPTVIGAPEIILPRSKGDRVAINHVTKDNLRIGSHVIDLIQIQSIDIKVVFVAVLDSDRR